MEIDFERMLQPWNEDDWNVRDWAWENAKLFSQLQVKGQVRNEDGTVVVTCASDDGKEFYQVWQKGESGKMRLVRLIVDKS